MSMWGVIIQALGSAKSKLKVQTNEIKLELYGETGIPLIVTPTLPGELNMEYQMGTTRAVFQQPFDSNTQNGRLIQNQDPASPSMSALPKRNKITDFFQISRIIPQKQQKFAKEFLYLPAENVTTEDLVQQGGRKTVIVNDKEVALVSHQNVIYAIDSKCPHIGGPIDLGDIEEVPGCGPCIKCPWHNWTFSLTTGRCIFPHNRNADKNLETYPVQLDPANRTIKIGFTEISPKTFNSVPE